MMSLAQAQYRVNRIYAIPGGRTIADVHRCGTILWEDGEVCGCYVRDVLLLREGRAYLRACSRHEAELDENAGHE